jgi:hypothetical protein
MGKKTTLKELADMLTHVIKHMATKEQIIALHLQVNSIEKEHLGIKYVKLEDRVEKLERKALGARA